MACGIFQSSTEKLLSSKTQSCKRNLEVLISPNPAKRGESDVTFSVDVRSYIICLIPSPYEKVTPILIDGIFFSVSVEFWKILHVTYFVRLSLFFIRLVPMFS